MKSHKYWSIGALITTLKRQEVKNKWQQQL